MALKMVLGSLLIPVSGSGHGRGQIGCGVLRKGDIDSLSTELLNLRSSAYGSHVSSPALTCYDSEFSQQSHLLVEIE